MSRPRALARIRAATRREVLLQNRYGFYAISVFVVLVFGATMQLLPAAVRDDTTALVPAFVLANVMITTFYFAGALVLLERDEGMVAAIVTTPLRPSEYLFAKVITLSALAATESLLVVAAAFGLRFDWPLLAAGTLLLGATFVLAGFASVAPYASIDRWLIPSVPVVTFLLLPMLSLFGLTPAWLLAVHPAGPALLLAGAAAGHTADAVTLVMAGAGAFAWCCLALALALRSFERHVEQQVDA